MSADSPACLMADERVAADAVADPAATIVGPCYRITVLADGLLRCEYAADGRFEDRPSTLARRRRMPVPDFTATDRDAVLELVTRRLRLTYDRGPFTPAGLRVEALGGISAYTSVWRYGEPAGGLGGTARTLDEADGAVPLDPGVISRQGFAVLDDSGSMVFEPDGWVSPRDGSRTDLYVFAYAHDYLDALHAFYELSGPVPLLPRWALGNWWSRFYRYTADEYRDLMRRFAAEGVPFSVAVLDMDWHVTDIDPRLGSGWTGYSWNRELFSDPAAFLTWLHEHGLRVTLNVHPADGVRPHEDAFRAMCAALGRIPNDEPIAFDVTNRAFLAAYFDVLHHGLEADGVDFWWLDWQSGPCSRVAGIDPLWMLNHFHFRDAGRDGRRPLTFSRYAGPGSHRYPIGFSGDTVISWATLAFQPLFTATATNIGYGWWSHDIGGHFHGVKDDELATRWVQLGCFSPILRLHASNNPFTDKAPWTFSCPAREIQVRFLRLRHRLIPYLHTMNHRAAAAGIPLVLPMYYRWPDDEHAYHVGHEYCFGSELVVAAVTSPADPVTRMAHVRTWLPPGVWVDVMTGRSYDGNRMLNLHRPLDILPVLAAPGAIIPLDGASVPGNDPAHPAHLEVFVVPGADGQFTLVEDDGTGDGRDPMTVARTAIRYRDGGDADNGGAGTGGSSVTIGPAVGCATCVPAVRTWTVTLVAADERDADRAARGAPAAPRVGRDATASIDGVPAPVDARRDGHGLRLVVRDVPATSRLELHLGRRVALAHGDVAAGVFAVLDRAYAEHDRKAEAYAVATSPEPLHVRLSHLHALGLPESLASAVEEMLVAQGA